MNEIKKGLPEGWENARLGDIARVVWGDTSITKKSYISKGVPAFSAAGQDGFLERAQWKGPGIVLSAIGARCGKCFLAKGKWTAIKNTIVIQGDPDYLDHHYLWLYLNDEKKWPIGGSGQPFITMGKAQDVLLPLPPSHEQRRIVAKVEELLGRVNVVRERLAKVMEILKRFRQSVLAAACSGRLTVDWRLRNGFDESAKELLEEILVKRKTLARESGWPRNDPIPPERLEIPELPDGWVVATIDQLASLVTSGSRGWARYNGVDLTGFVRYSIG